jgi:hypothetical protein
MKTTKIICMKCDKAVPKLQLYANEEMCGNCKCERVRQAMSKNKRGLSQFFNILK